MSEAEIAMAWEPEVKEKFDAFIVRMPVFHRRIAEKLVSEQAEKNAQARRAARVNEEDLLNAIFSEVPHPFYTMMLRLLHELNFDYKKYGLPKTSQ